MTNIIPMRNSLKPSLDVFVQMLYTCQKDDFLLPVSELMTDTTTSREALSFTD